MAMCENLDYDYFCPSESFEQYEKEHNEIPEFWKFTRCLLGDRPKYMAYIESDSYYNGWPYVVDCLIGATNTMGIEIACMLKQMNPKVGRKILVTDVINPFKIPQICRCWLGDQEVFTAISDDMYLFEDNRYMCGMIDEGEVVHMYFFKK